MLKSVTTLPGTPRKGISFSSHAGVRPRIEPDKPQFEHIAAPEILFHKRSVRYVKILWSKYRQAILANQLRH
jgi:hypothetical protein